MQDRQRTYDDDDVEHPCSAAEEDVVIFATAPDEPLQSSNIQIPSISTPTSSPTVPGCSGDPFIISVPPAHMDVNHHLRRGIKQRKASASINIRTIMDVKEHFWLVQHDLDTVAHIKMFDTAAQLVDHATNIVLQASTAPTKKALDCLSHTTPALNGARTPKEATDRVDTSFDLIPARNDAHHLIRQRALDQQHEGNYAHPPAFGYAVTSATPPPPANEIQRHSGRKKRSQVGKQRKSLSTSKSNRSSRSSSSSSSSSSDSSDAITRSYWLDVQSSSSTTIKTILSLFGLDDITVDNLLEIETVDKLESFPSSNYVFVNLQCQELKLSGEPGEPVIVSVVAFEDWIVTVHKLPFCGMFEVIRRIQNVFNLRGNLKKRSAHLRSSASVRPSSFDVGLMSTGWVMSTLVDFVVEAFLPDPISLLNEVDTVDELVLCFASSQGNQSDLLRRVALLRKKISTLRHQLFEKEKFLQQLLSPAMRSIFVSKNHRNAEQYKHTLGQIEHVGGRLDSARDVLSQANSNFVSGVSMQLATTSNQMNGKMQLLSFVTTLCLPLNIITGAFGMNVRVPFQVSEREDSIVAFLVIVGMLLFLVLLATPKMYSLFKAISKKGVTATFESEA